MDKKKKASKMTQQIKALASKFVNLSSVPKTHMVEENRFLTVVPLTFTQCYDICIINPTIQNKC